MAKVFLEIRSETYRRLRHLSEAADYGSVSDMLLDLLEHVDQGIYRDGSRQREFLTATFGEKAIDEAARTMYVAGDEPKPVPEGQR